MKMKLMLLLTAAGAVLGLFFGLEASAASDYRVNQALSVTVNEWSECRIVTNQAGAKDTFIPTNTSLEWSEFRIHYPSHISLALCNSTLTVAKAGTGSGTVTSNPAGINCGATCSASYASGTTVTLTAAASAGSTFTGWSGGGCSGNGACTVTINANTTVTATFTLTYTLTVAKAGTGSGTVTSNPAGINCGATCSASYASGTTITLTAVASAGSTFTGWSGGGCSGNGACTVTLSANTTVTATFTINTYTLTVAKAGTGSGTVTSNPAGINCGATCSAGYASGTTVTLAAVASAGSTFTGWSGGGCSGNGACTVTVSANTTVTATFNAVPYALAITKSGQGSGTVASNPAGINCGGTCNAVFNGGASIILTATPDASSKFAGWSGGGCSGTGACTITLTANTTVDAKFNPATCTVVPGGGKRIFVTSNLYQGPSIRTNAAANAICQNLATAAGISGTYKALIYLHGVTPSSLLPDAKPIYTAGFDLSTGCDWHLVANNEADMIDCDSSCTKFTLDPATLTYLKYPIKFDEKGTERAYSVWTNFGVDAPSGWNLTWVDMGYSATQPVKVIKHTTWSSQNDPFQVLYSCCGTVTCLPCIGYYLVNNKQGGTEAIYGHSNDTNGNWAIHFSYAGDTAIIPDQAKCGWAIKRYDTCDKLSMALYCIEQ